MAEQTNIFSMFGITDEAEEKRKREEQEHQKRIEEQKSKTSSPSNKSNQDKEDKKKDEFKIKTDTHFYHLGEYIPVVEYVSPEEIEYGITKKKKGEEVVEPITSDDLRKRLEKDYPDLVKGYTELVYVKKKNLVIAVSQAKKKGLTNDCPNGQSPSSLPKIPFHILEDFIRFAWTVYIEKGTECHADIYFDYDKENFFLDIPEQQASAVNVEVIESPAITAERLAGYRFLKVMEIHSHHHMEPIPSMTDDQSERGNVLYAIIGNLNHYMPDISLRYFHQIEQRHVGLDLHQVFDNPFKKTSRFSTDSVEAVTQI